MQERHKVAAELYDDQVLDREGPADAKNTMAKLLASWVTEIVKDYHQVAYLSVSVGHLIGPGLCCQANKVQRTATKNMVLRCLTGQSTDCA